jgi:hypothetical protein
MFEEVQPLVNKRRLVKSWHMPEPGGCVVNQRMSSLED